MRELQTPQPRPHQTAALLDLQRALAAHDRAQLVMACGTGKTFVGRWHAQACDAELVLVLLPSLALVAQTLQEWRRATGQVNTGWHFQALVVCSDPTTAAGASERDADQDGIELGDRSWNAQQARVTTDPAVAARFLRERQPGKPRVVFSTYHSAPVVADAMALASSGSDEPVAFDLAICDEAHRLAGRPSAAFATVLDPRAIVARKRLFMTATPKPYAGEDGYSMDDPSVFGPVAHTVSFGEAISTGMLTDYRVVVIDGRGNKAEDRLALVPAVLAKVVDEYGLTRMLTFHGRVAKAEGFAAAIDGVRTPAGSLIRGRHVSGSMRAAQRAGALNWLADQSVADGEVRLVSNARCLSEGVDVPAVDAVMFADQRSSIVDIIQAVGRVLRPAAGKSIGTIVLPVGLDDLDDDSSLSLSAYAHVWTVLRGLRAHDQRLAEDIDAAVRQSAREGGWTGKNLGGFRMPRIEFVVPESASLDELHLRVVQELGSAWERHYGHLQAWAQAHNGKLIPRAEKVSTADGAIVYLGEWCEQQRILRRRGVLDAERAARLEEIPGWAWDKAEAWWRNTYRLLVDYAAEHGTVADNQQGESRFKGMKNASYPRQDLGIWMAQQRQAYRLGTLPNDYTALLEQLPGWTWDGGLPDVDVNHVEALRQFVEFEKHANVPEGHIEDGLRLSAWCWNVRLRHLTGRLSPVLRDEILAATPSKELSSVRFQWEKEETLWRLKFFALKQFALREGHCRARSWTVEEFQGEACRIGNWAAQQRFKYRQGDLDPKRAELLEALPGWEWEIDLLSVEPEEPVDLTGFATEHGRPGAFGKPHYCKCEVCLTAKRKTAREHARRKVATIVDPVDAEPVREHLIALEARFSELQENGSSRNGRVLASAITGVSLGLLRKVIAGRADEIERTHAERLLALTVEELVAAKNREGSRGREISDLTAKVDSAPAFELLDDLASRGFGITWVGRELGYTGAPQIRRGGKTQARLVKAIRELHARVGDLVMPPVPRSVRPPSLAELLAGELATHYARPLSTDSDRAQEAS